MTLIAGENICKQFNQRTIFKDLSFSVNEDDRIGLVGPNGIGKTTLFQLMASRLTPDSGNIARSKYCRIAYLEQEFSSEQLQQTLFGYVSAIRDDLTAARLELEEAEQALAENPSSQKAMEILGEAQHRFEALGGYRFETEVRTILHGLGFPENRFHNRLENFSGGEKNRASLARLLAGKSTLLLLDEPTNHLDIESTIWLEEFLAKTEKAYIIVSHDRMFLNNTVKKVWELAGGKIEQYFNGFAGFLREREERKEQLEHLYRHQQEEIRRIEDFIRRNIAGQKTKQAQSKMKYLSRIKRIELPTSESNPVAFRLQSGNRSYNLILSLESAYFGYGHHPVVREVSFTLYRGDRVALVGRNGSGKTTILRTILGELEPIDGAIRLGQKVDVAYFDQELSDLNDDNTVLDEIWQLEPLAEAGRMRTFLARFGFRGEDVLKKISVLSGGEKTKLALAKLLYMPANFLILDEPTNHLDIDARQALEEALREYQGAYLVVSHDRYFIDRIADKILYLENGAVRIFDGNYSYLKEKLDAERERVAPAKKGTDPERLKEYFDFKKISQYKGRIKKELKSLTSRISDHELILKRLDEDIERNIPKTDWERLTAAYQEKNRIENLLLELYSRLEELKELDAQYSDIERQSDSGQLD